MRIPDLSVEINKPDMGDLPWLTIEPLEELPWEKASARLGLRIRRHIPAQCADNYAQWDTWRYPEEYVAPVKMGSMT